MLLERRSRSINEAYTRTLPEDAGNVHSEATEHGEYGRIIYDDIDEQAIVDYYGLNQATVTAIRPVQADYDRLGAGQTTDNSTENIEMSEVDADTNHRDAVSKPFLNARILCRVNY